MLVSEKLEWKQIDIFILNPILFSLEPKEQKKH